MIGKEDLTPKDDIKIHTHNKNCCLINILNLILICYDEFSGFQLHMSDHFPFLLDDKETRKPYFDI